MKGYIVVMKGREEEETSLYDKGGRGEILESVGWTVYKNRQDAERIHFECVSAGVDDDLEIREVQLTLL